MTQKRDTRNRGIKLPRLPDMKLSLTIKHEKYD